jgi:ABC-2 type transport system permease protein
VKLLDDYHWVPHVFSIELKKTFSYRLMFWAQFFMGTGTEIAVNYFVWLAVFAAKGTDNIAGFTFHGMVFYLLFAGFASKITRGTERGYISNEIYDGSLNRYLLYPLAFFPYKYVTHLLQQMMGVVQMVITFALLRLALGDSGGHPITLGSLFAGIATCLLTGYVHFVLMSCIELVAFWQDVIWNLMVMTRFCMSLLGGGMVPLALFPEWGRHAALLTPFPALVSFPARTFLGEVGAREWVQNAGVLALWGIGFSLLLNWIWQKGTRHYSGVGI